MGACLLLGRWPFEYCHHADDACYVVPHSGKHIEFFLFGTAVPLPDHADNYQVRALYRSS